MGVEGVVTMFSLSLLRVYEPEAFEDGQKEAPVLVRVARAWRILARAFATSRFVFTACSMRPSRMGSSKDFHQAVSSSPGAGAGLPRSSVHCAGASSAGRL